MKVERPRVTLNSSRIGTAELGIVIDALKKAPCEPLGLASLEPLTYKATFLLAVASAGKAHEPQDFIV